MEEYAAKRGRPKKDVFSSKQKKLIKEHNERVARLDSGSRPVCHICGKESDFMCRVCGAQACNKCKSKLPIIKEHVGMGLVCKKCTEAAEKWKGKPVACPVCERPMEFFSEVDGHSQWRCHYDGFHIRGKCEGCGNICTDIAPNASPPTCCLCFLKVFSHGILGEVDLPRERAVVCPECRTRADKEKPGFKVGDKVILKESKFHAVVEVLDIKDDGPAHPYPLIKVQGVVPDKPEPEWWSADWFRKATPDEISSSHVGRASPGFKVGDKVTQTELSGKTIGTVLSVHDKSLVVEFVKGRPVELPSKELRKSTPEELAKAEPSGFKVGDKVVPIPNRIHEGKIGEVMRLQPTWDDKNVVDVQFTDRFAQYEDSSLRHATPEEIAKAEPSGFKVGDKVVKRLIPDRTHGLVGTVEDLKPLTVRWPDGEATSEHGYWIRDATPDEIAKAESSGFGFKVGDKVIVLGFDDVPVGTIERFDQGSAYVCFMTRGGMYDRWYPLKRLRMARMDELPDDEDEIEEPSICENCGEQNELDQCARCDSWVCDVCGGPYGGTSHGAWLCHECAEEVEAGDEVSPEPPALPSNRCRRCHSILVTRQSLETGLCEGCRAGKRWLPGMHKFSASDWGIVLHEPKHIYEFDARPVLYIGGALAAMYLLIYGAGRLLGQKK